MQNNNNEKWVFPQQLLKATPEEFVNEAVRWAIVKDDEGANLYGITRLATMDEVLQDVASVLKLDIRALIPDEVAPPNYPEIDTEPLMVLHYYHYGRDTVVMFGLCEDEQAVLDHHAAHGGGDGKVYFIK